MCPYVHLGQYTLYSFGLCLGIGVAISICSFAIYFKHTHPPVNLIWYCVVLGPPGVVGAHLCYYFTHPKPVGSGWWIRLFDINDGGFSYFGGFLAVLITFIGISAIRGCPSLPLLDSTFCVGPMYALGKFGCFLAGDGDYGAKTNKWWGVSFPHGLVPITFAVQPTMLFLAGWELFIYILFWRLARRTQLRSQMPGAIFGLYLAAMGVGRYLILFLSDDASVNTRLQALQSLYLLTALVGIVTAIFSWKHYPSR